MHPHQYAAHASPGEEWEAGQEENDGEKKERGKSIYSHSLRTVCLKWERLISTSDTIWVCVRKT